MIGGGKRRRTDYSNFIIGKELASGGNGTVYLATIGKEKFAYKIERMDVYDPKKPLQSEYYRQLEFDKDVCRKHPNKFLTIKNHGIIKDCKYVHPKTEEFLERMQGDRLRRFLRKNGQPNCYYLLYSPFLDGDFKSVHLEIYGSSKLFLDFMYQMVDTINIIRKAGYSQNDYNPGNIMYKTTGKKRQPYQWYLIDYGNLYNKDFPTSALDEDIRDRPSYALDMCQFISTVSGSNSPLLQYIKKHELKLKFTFDELVEILKEDEREYNKIKPYIPAVLPDKLKSRFITNLLRIIKPNLYLKLAGNSKEIYEDFRGMLPYPDLLAYCLLHYDDKNYDGILKKIKETMSEASEPIAIGGYAAGGKSSYVIKKNNR